MFCLIVFLQRTVLTSLENLKYLSYLQNYVPWHLFLKQNKKLNNTAGYMPFFSICLEHIEIRVLCIFGVITLQLVDNKHRRYISYYTTFSTFRLRYISLLKCVNCYCKTAHC